MTNEEWYDHEIAPKLAELANQCGERGLSFLSVVEYAPGERSRTKRLTPDAGLEMVMVNLCAAAAPNIDGFVIELARYCREKGVSTDASIVMRKLAKNEQ